MTNITTLICFLLILNSCEGVIKKSKVNIEDEVHSDSQNSYPSLKLDSNNYLIGFWVGFFEKDKDSNNNKSIYFDEGLYWNRENKINISIDNIIGEKVIGHSVVAGNHRPFSGEIHELPNSYQFKVSEPGNDKFDGQFIFIISKKDSLLSGTWVAFKKIEIQNRKFSLTKKIFKYNPNQTIYKSRKYADWSKQKTIKLFNLTEEEKDEYGEFEKNFESATDRIYTINASITILKKQDLENLKRGDLIIIRNTIYARHGYSFRNRPLRLFFDAQEWYIPVHSNIKKELTEIEKKNIQLLLKYEKNAAEYYDYFGRG